jgi:serine/threonine protein kinase
MDLINNKYVLLNKIGSGSFGFIYKGQNVRTKEFVAIKVEPIEHKLKMLKNESMIFWYLNGCDYVPSVKWYGKDEVNYYMVINLLGNSLQDLMNNMQMFTPILILKIGIKIVNILKIIHEKGLVHRDIKPDNFLFGVNEVDKLYLIDFGLCKSYLNKNGEHNPLKKTSSLIGSKNYASINSHECNELSRRDDLESFCYMLLYLYHGFLPWNDIVDESLIVTGKKILLNMNNSPKFILDLLSYVSAMNYEEKPNYYLIMHNFQRELETLSNKII